MLVKDVMSRKVLMVASTASFEDIVSLLTKNKISGCPVVNKKGKVVGIVSEKDLFFKLFPPQKKFYKDPKFYMSFDRLEKDARHIKKIKARKLMSREIISIESDDHVLKACSLFVRNRIRRLPVIDKGKLVGIVTTNNIYRKFLSSVIK